MKLFGHPESGHAFKVRLCLKLAGIKHDYEVVDIFADRDKRQQEFMDSSRFGEVPVLLDDGQALVQSNAILLHIATQHRLMGGQDSQLLNRCTEWLFWEANKIGMCLPQLRVAEKFEPEYLSKSAKDWVTSRYNHDVNVIENELADGRSFILGDEVTIADCSLCGYLYFADEAKVTVPANVSRWLQRIAGLPGWQHPYSLMA